MAAEDGFSDDAGWAADALRLGKSRVNELERRCTRGGLQGRGLAGCCFLVREKDALSSLGSLAKNGGNRGRTTTGDAERNRRRRGAAGGG